MKAKTILIIISISILLGAGLVFGIYKYRALVQERDDLASQASFLSQRATISDSLITYITEENNALKRTIDSLKRLLQNKADDFADSIAYYAGMRDSILAMPDSDVYDSLNVIYPADSLEEKPFRLAPSQIKPIYITKLERDSLSVENYFLKSAETTYIDIIENQNEIIANDSVLIAEYAEKDSVNTELVKNQATQIGRQKKAIDTGKKVLIGVAVAAVVEFIIIIL